MLHVKESTVIRPAQETPKHCLPTSDLDMLVPPVHVAAVYFYRRPNGSSNFFEAGLLKEALSKVLVPLYPVAGRLEKGENGRIMINCNAKGVLFLEAEASYVTDDFTDCGPSSKLWQFVPTVELTNDISSYPLLLIQVTYFKCGGVCLGFRLSHTLADGASTFYIINSWAEITRGLPITISPSYDRTPLSIGIPPSPTFHHIEYDPPPSMNSPTQNSGNVSTAVLKLSLDQINILKEEANKENESNAKYSKFEIIAAHIWRCVCKARGLSDDQASKLYIAINGRSKLNPRLPSGYIGNVVFSTGPLELSGDILSKPLSYTVERVHKALKGIDDEYLKSALAYVRQQCRTVLNRAAVTYNTCPNLCISKLGDTSAYEANFGWGRPLFVTPIIADADGIIFILPSTSNDGSLSLAIGLETNHMQLFKNLFYEIFLRNQNVRSKY